MALVSSIRASTKGCVTCHKPAGTTPPLKISQPNNNNNNININKYISFFPSLCRGPCKTGPVWADDGHTNIKSTPRSQHLLLLASLLKGKVGLVGTESTPMPYPHSDVVTQGKGIYLVNVLNDTNPINDIITISVLKYTKNTMFND